MLGAKRLGYLAGLIATMAVCLSCSMYTLSGGVYNFRVSGPIPLKGEDILRRAWWTITQYLQDRMIFDKYDVTVGRDRKSIIVEKNTAHVIEVSLFNTDIVRQCQRFSLVIESLTSLESNVDMNAMVYDGLCDPTIEHQPIEPAPKLDAALNELHGKILKALKPSFQVPPQVEVPR